MASLATKIKLYAEASGKTNIDFFKDVRVQDDSDGNGPYIKEWNIDDLAQPTAEQLAPYDAASITEEANNVVRQTRKKAYGDIGDQLDLLYKDIVADKLDTTGEWAKKIKAVKDANAKE